MELGGVRRDGAALRAGARPGGRAARTASGRSLARRRHRDGGVAVRAAAAGRRSRVSTSPRACSTARAPRLRTSTSSSATARTFASRTSPSTSSAPASAAFSPPTTRRPRGKLRPRLPRPARPPGSRIPSSASSTTILISMRPKAGIRSSGKREHLDELLAPSFELRWSARSGSSKARTGPSCSSCGRGRLLLFRAMIADLDDAVLPRASRGLHRAVRAVPRGRSRAVPPPVPAGAGDEAMSEVVDLLQRLVQVDTVNPPGNETRAAELLREYLEDSGVACELYAKVPERANLVARIPGSSGGPRLSADCPTPTPCSPTRPSGRSTRGRGGQGRPRLGTWRLDMKDRLRRARLRSLRWRARASSRRAT